MKYYSEKTNKVYDTEKELRIAEKKFNDEETAKKAKSQERADEAKKVEALYKEAYDARKKADKACSEFVKKYGSFHQTITDVDLPVSSVSLFDYLFSDFWNI